MNDTAYSLAASIFSYIFAAVIVYILLRLAVLSLREYREVKKARTLQNAKTAGRIEFISPEEYAGYVFSINRETVIGRGRRVDIVVPDKLVEKRHLAIFERRSGIFAADYGTRTGSFVNGSRILKHDVRLKSGDIISLGSDISFRVIFEGDAVTPSSEDASQVAEADEPSLQSAPPRDINPLSTATYGEESEDNHDA